MKKLLYLLGVTVILCGEMVFAIYSSTVEFDKDMDAKLRLPHTAIGKKDLRRPLPITVNSWRYEIPFLGDNDFESKALEFSKLLSDRQEIISELKRDNRYKIRVVLYVRTGQKQVNYTLDPETISNLAKLGLGCDVDLIVLGDDCCDADLIFSDS